MLKRRVGIIGWHERSAGLIDSWLPEIGYEVKLFIGLNDSFAFVDTRAHVRYGNTSFSYPKNHEFKGRPLINDERWYENASNYPVDAFIVALDNNQERIKNIDSAKLLGSPLFNAIHPSAIFLKEHRIGTSCIIHANSLIGYKAWLGDGVIVNTGSQIDHHTVLEDGISIDPGCVIAGNVLIKKGAHLHSSATVINKIVIGARARVGAGSVVIRDVDEGVTVVGNPARQI
jgi:serine O-acetyltransferase